MTWLAQRYHQNEILPSKREGTKQKEIRFLSKRSQNNAEWSCLRVDFMPDTG
jgi:hypothetical protein